MTSSFVLHERLVSDTVPVGDMDLSRLLLMNDSRFPWLVLVPRKAGCTELFDLSSSEQSQLVAEISRVSRALLSIAPAEKVNIGALGNVVSQFHVHVVARSTNDAAWPGPVWGFGKSDRYTKKVQEDLLKRIANAVELKSHLF